MVGFLPSCCTFQPREEKERAEGDEISVYKLTSLMAVTLERGVLIAEDLEKRGLRMRVFHKAIKLAVYPLQYCELRRFRVKIGNLIERKCVLLWSCTVVIFHEVNDFFSCA